MHFDIREINEENSGNTNKYKSEFIVESKLDLYMVNNEVKYTIVPVSAYKKVYEEDDIDSSDCIKNKNKTIYFAYVNDEIAGQIILKKYWNNYAYIDDIRVYEKFRKIGIGSALIEKAKNWAKIKNLPGIMLETQHINVNACKLYEKSGFKIGGLDKNLYKGIKKDTDEIALYWYYMF